MVTGSDRRVVRGGAWHNAQRLARCAVRFRPVPDFFAAVGFRVVVPVKLAGVVSQPNSSVLDSGPRVVRGGFWISRQGNACCAARLKAGSDLFFTRLGFRVVVSVGLVGTVSQFSTGENKMQDFLTQFVDAVAERVVERLGQSQAGLAQTVDIDLVTIPAGEFLYGEDKEPQHLPEYRIGKYPVTNAQYTIFVQETGHQVPRHWQDGQVPAGKERHPVVNISWHDAIAFCNWLSGRLGVSVSLPTEAQWEKAAGGTDGREYPWGNEFDKTKANTWESGIGDTTPVDTYPEGISPYGVWDMAGNVWEWTNDKWE